MSHMYILYIYIHNYIIIYIYCTWDTQSICTERYVFPCGLSFVRSNEEPGASKPFGMYRTWGINGPMLSVSKHDPTNFWVPQVAARGFPVPDMKRSFKDHGSGVKRGFFGLHDQWLTRGWNLVARWRCCDLRPADQKQVRLDSLRFDQIKTVYLRLGVEHELVFGTPIIIFPAMSSLKNRFVLF